MAATAVTLNDLEGHSPLAGLFKCNPSNICAAFYTISTDSVLARFLCISRASCYLHLLLLAGSKNGSTINSAVISRALNGNRSHLYCIPTIRPTAHSSVWWWSLI